MSLQEYSRKRNFQKTDEPPASSGKGKKGTHRFAIHKHDASRLHYDLRLEIEGTLKSWAVPKGLPYNKGEKHLAVKVEDHPLSYIDFEGTIPQGEYGGGTIMLWDTGTFKALTPEKELSNGKLHFILKGKKLYGEWYLVRLRDEDQWLVIKGGEEMNVVSKKDDNTSALTGRTMEAISKSKEIRSVKSAVKPKTNKIPLPSTKVVFIEPMKARLVGTAPPGEWSYEIKFDGWRALALKGKSETRLLSRNENDFSDKFPEIKNAIADLAVNDAIIDGEIVALDEKGRSSFQLLQSFDNGETRPQIFFYVFDLLQLNGQDLQSLPLEKRKAQLEKLFPHSNSVLRYSASLGNDAVALLEQAKKLGLEGLIGKKTGSLYQSGHRSGAWIKLKLVNEQEFVIGGYTEPSGTRKHIGALLVGFHKAGKLVYASKVGTGFSEKNLRSLHETFQKMATAHCPFINLPEKRNSKWGQSITAAEMKNCNWVKPILVCQIKFSEWTRDEHLRHPVFLRLRDDKKASEVIHE